MLDLYLLFLVELSCCFCFNFICVLKHSVLLIFVLLITKTLILTPVSILVGLRCEKHIHSSGN